MKKLLAFSILLIGSLTLVACDALTQEESSPTSYTALDINPSIEFLTDEDDMVISIDLVNEDAVIVAADLELVGLHIDEAIEIYLNQAIELGYIDVDSEENIITVTVDDETKEPGRIDHIEGFLGSKGIGAAIFGGGMNETYFELAETYDISPGQARMLSRAVEIDEELTLEEALELSHQEIMSILRGYHRENMQAFAQERRETAMQHGQAMRERAANRVQEHMDNHDELDIPDYDSIRENARERMSEMRDAYQERRNNLRD